MKRQLFGVLALAAALLMIAAACTSGGSQTTRRTEAERGVETEVESDAGGSAEQECEEARDEAECELESALSGQPHPENIIEHLDGYESYFFGQRAAPATLVPPGAFQAALGEAAAIEPAPARVLGATSTWQNAGPQPVNSEDPAYQDPVVNNFGGGWGIDSGRVTAIAVDPRNDSTVYMGAADGGVWKTTDGGATWTPLGDQLDTQTIGSIAIVPQNTNTRLRGHGRGEHELRLLFRSRRVQVDRRWRIVREDRRLAVRREDRLQDRRPLEGPRLRRHQPGAVSLQERGHLVQPRSSPPATRTRSATS